VAETVRVGTYPVGIAYDSAKGEMFVANYGASSLTVLSDTAGTATSLSCSPQTVGMGGSSTCTATVIGSRPTGTVNYTQNSPNGASVTLSSPTCVLSSGSCSITVTGSSAGFVDLVATYEGDVNNEGGWGSSSVTIVPVFTATATVTQAPTVTTTQTVSAITTEFLTATQTVSSQPTTAASLVATATTTVATTSSVIPGSVYLSVGALAAALVAALILLGFVLRTRPSRVPQK